MNNTQHTCGPWAIETKDSGSEIRSAQTGEVIAHVCEYDFDDYGPQYPSAGQSLSNARLIAAAPELLEALKQMVEHLETREDFTIEDASEGNENCYTRASAAINKATK